MTGNIVRAELKWNIENIPFGHSIGRIYFRGDKYNMPTQPLVAASYVQTKDDLFVVPFYSALDAKGVASLNLVQQESVKMAYDLSFNKTLVADENSAAILNAFELTQDGTNLTVGMRMGADALAFRTELADVIRDAVDLSQNTLAEVLYNDAVAYFAEVYGDLVANVLETDWALRVTVDASGGAANMWGDLDAKEQARLLIAEQIPNSTYMLYVDASENMITDSLPMKNGDTLVFLFNVTMQTISRAVNEVQAQGSMAGALAGYATQDPSGGFYGKSSKLPGPGKTGPNGYLNDVSGATDASGSFLDVSSDAINDLLSSPGAAASFTYTQQIAAFYVKITGTSEVKPTRVKGLVGVAGNLSTNVARDENADGSVTYGGGMNYTLDASSNAVLPRDGPDLALVGGRIVTA